MTPLLLPVVPPVYARLAVDDGSAVCAASGPGSKPAATAVRSTPASVGPRESSVFSPGTRSRRSAARCS